MGVHDQGDEIESTKMRLTVVVPPFAKSSHYHAVRIEQLVSRW